ncbi:MAG: ABC transporter ATP-binding protein [Candidatus Bathyarchaeota archaeon]|nr:MAG: ABC transporter ATP-binding protein [Candidatus Bathyarchaeota archaeon]
MTQTNNIIETANLSKIYRLRNASEIKAVDEVNLKVKEGQFLTILGPSGSGKTTLLNLLGGLDRPTTGEIRIDGLELSKLTERELVKVRREKVGFVFQVFNLIPTLTALENVEVALAPTVANRSKRLERSSHLLEWVGLGQRTHHLPAELSAGEQQRIAIARAFANEPKILLLDEPTVNLDTATGREIMKMCHKANKEHCQTVVTVTHARYVREFTDRLLYMRDGKLYTQIPEEEL